MLERFCSEGWFSPNAEIFQACCAKLLPTRVLPICARYLLLFVTAAAQKYLHRQLLVPMMVVFERLHDS